MVKQLLKHNHTSVQSHVITTLKVLAINHTYTDKLTTILVQSEDFYQNSYTIFLIQT